MSRLLVLTRPSFVAGFNLAGVDAYGAEDIETAQELIETWLQAGESGLLAIDDGLLSKLDVNLLRKLETCDQLPHLAIPGGQPPGPEISRRFRIAQMIRRAIGFHITFAGEEVEVEE